MYYTIAVLEGPCDPQCIMKNTGRISAVCRFMILARILVVMSV